MGVGNPIAHLTTRATGPHQPGQAQLAKLVARRRLGSAHQQGDVTDPHLPCLEQCVDDLKAAGIRQELEPSGQMLGIGAGHARVWSLVTIARHVTII